MNPDSCRTSPAVAPNEIEWVFADSTPSLVAHIPDREGYYSAVRLDIEAPISPHEREFVRALLRLAQRVMDDSEPAVTTGAVA